MIAAKRESMYRCVVGISMAARVGVLVEDFEMESRFPLDWRSRRAANAGRLDTVTLLDSLLQCSPAAPVLTELSEMTG